MPSLRLTLCLLGAWICVFLIISRGVKSSGKCSYFLALFPYVIMIALLVRAITLEGAMKGIVFFLKPQWHELINPKVISNFKDRFHYFLIEFTKFAVNYVDESISLLIFGCESTHNNNRQSTRSSSITMNISIRVVSAMKNVLRISTFQTVFDIFHSKKYFCQCYNSNSINFLPVLGPGHIFGKFSENWNVLICEMNLRLPYWMYR